MSTVLRHPAVGTCAARSVAVPSSGEPPPAPACAVRGVGGRLDQRAAAGADRVAVGGHDKADDLDVELPGLRELTGARRVASRGCPACCASNRANAAVSVGTTSWSVRAITSAVAGVVPGDSGAVRGRERLHHADAEALTAEAGQHHDVGLGQQLRLLVLGDEARKSTRSAMPSARVGLQLVEQGRDRRPSPERHVRQALAAQLGDRAAGAGRPCARRGGRGTARAPGRRARRRRRPDRR